MESLHWRIGVCSKTLREGRLEYSEPQRRRAKGLNGVMDYSVKGLALQRQPHNTRWERKTPETDSQTGEGRGEGRPTSHNMKNRLRERKGGRRRKD